MNDIFLQRFGFISMPRFFLQKSVLLIVFFILFASCSFSKEDRTISDEAVKNLYGGSLLYLIRNEARIEFAHEGMRFFDIRRWNILLDVMNKPIGGIEYYEDTDKGHVKKVLVPAVRTTYTSKDFWWPIPQEEIDVNEGRLTQNKDW